MFNLFNFSKEEKSTYNWKSKAVERKREIEKLKKDNKRLKEF